MEYRILGPLEIADGNGLVAVTAPKQRSLLLCLLLHRGEVVSGDRIADALWGDSPPASATKIVQMYVAQLRRALGDEAVETVAPGYRVRVGAEAIDAARFERLLFEGRRTLANGNPELAASLLRRALGLWRGRALEDVVYASFATAEAERLEELRLACLEERFAADLALGRSEDVLPEISALVTEHPLRERLRAHLMLALYRSGRQAEALEAYRDARRALHDGLGLNPGLELRELEKAILRQDSALISPEQPAIRLSRLPVAATPLVGRERELAELRVLLDRPDVRLVTLAGAGGSGKTRLALALAESCGDLFANGVALVELAPLRDPALVLPAVAQAVGLGEEPGVPLECTLADWLAERELMLVADNLEHLAGAERAVAKLVTASPRLTVVVTSRRVLHVSGEHVFPVQPLSEDDAVRLFEARATALDPAFALTPEEESDVREICRRLDGLPLAVELAAGRTRTLTVPALLARLAERLTLTGGPHDLPARQQTLRDTLAWSVDLLGSEERRDLVRLAVFARGCTLEAAETVCDTNLDRLATLVDHSLVRRDIAAEEPRFVMLETVRDFARELLQVEEDVHELGRRHARYYVELAERAESQLGGQDQGGWLARLEAEHDECRLALDRLARDGEAALELRLAAALGRFRYVRGYLSEGRAAIEGALGRGGEQQPALRAKAFRVGSAICVLQGDYERARELAGAGLALYRQEDDREGVARSLSNLGAILIASGEAGEAANTLDEAVALARTLEDKRVLALALNNRGDVALTQEDWPTASSLFAESLEVLRRLGDETNVARSLFNLGAAAFERGRDDEAHELLVDSLQRCVGLDDKEDIAWCLVALAALAERGGAAERGAALLGAADRLLEGMGATLKPYERRLYEQTSRALGSRLDEETLTALTARGRELALEEALAAV